VITRHHAGARLKTREESVVKSATIIARRLLPSLLGAALLCGAPAAADATCQLNSPNGKIKHVVYVEFDNVHFTRDNPHVPSDLEQMPNLLNFLEQNGTLDAGDRAVLISHTANDIITTETGLYSDNHGIAVANSFGVFSPPSPVTALFPSSFFYWTDAVQDIKGATMDPSFALLTPEGNNVPAPWVPFTRAGCDVGAFSTANIVLERTPFDTQKVFGMSSAQAMENNTAQTTEFVGEAIHCAIGSPLCTTANSAQPDLLPSEPGGYSNFEALFGAKYINTAFGTPLADLDGNTINGSNGVGGTEPGFPGFSPTATQTLGVVATMLEKGVPVVFAYIADAHDNRSAFGTFGPGQAGYETQLQQYNKAFGQFFTRLAGDGIDQTNTLFIFSPDEGDHFVGATPSPANCDGVTTQCNYSAIGELDIDLNQLTANAGNPTTYTTHFDDAPTVYITGNPGPTDPITRGLERTMAGLTAKNPYTMKTDNLMAAMADPTEASLLHMVVSADPARTPSFTFFGDPDYFFEIAQGVSATPTIGAGFAWNHGDIQPEIARTFIGIVGPGVRPLGATTAFFSDHTDVRPTLIFLTGLQDDYTHDGRVLTEVIDKHLLPRGLRSDPKQVKDLGQAYKAINAPFGPLAMASLQVSTAALQSNSSGDGTYLSLENEIEHWTQRRNRIAGRMKSMLEAAEFQGAKIDHDDAKDLIDEANDLVQEAQTAAQDLQPNAD
jgi:hypothetical protein